MRQSGPPPTAPPARGPLEGPSDSWGARVFRTLTGLPFAVTLIGVVAAALLAGLATPSGAAAKVQGFAVRGLLGLLAVAMVLVTWKRRPYPMPRFGFLLVHLAPALVLLGALGGAFRPAVVPGGPELPGPFRLFATPRPGPDRPARAYRVQEGLIAALPLAGCRVEVEQVLPNAVATDRVEENPAAPWNPALQVVLGLGLPEPLVGQLFAASRERFRLDEPGGRFAVVFREAWSEALLATLRPRPPQAELLVLDYLGKTAEASAQPGVPWVFPGFTLTVSRIYPDFAVRPGRDGQPEAHSRSDQPKEPWAQVELAQLGGATARLLLSAKHPELSDRLNAPNLPPGARLRYLRSGEEAQTRFVVFTREDRQIRLVTGGRVVRTEPLAPRKPFIVERGLSVTADALLDHGEPAFAPHPEASLAAQFLHPMLRLTLTDLRTGALERHWLEAGATVSCFQGRLDLAYAPAAPTLAPGRPRIAQGLVAVGFAFLLLGCPWMFYLKPWLKRAQAPADAPLPAPAKLPHRAAVATALALALLLAGSATAAALPQLLENPWRLAAAIFRAASFASLTAASALSLAALWARSDPREAPTLPWTRAGFLLLGAALVAASLGSHWALGTGWTWAPGEGLGLLAWFLVAGGLHLQRIKSVGGRTLLTAGLLAWGALLAALLA